jgi:predicted nucleotidyltransferase
MSQKDYKLEIIEKLLKSDSHMRGLAKALGTNQMMVSRKIKELEKINVVDYRQEGKNKVYFLKKTIEAQEYVYVAEHYKLIQLLKRYPILRGIIQKIRQNKKIKLAIFFGSYAKRLAHKDSDIDLYIETTNREIKEEIEGINTRLSVKIGKYDKNNLLIKEIKKNHVIIKGVEIYYEKDKFFS